MKISDVKFNWTDPNGKGKKALGNFTLDGAFRINFDLVEGSQGMFVSLPRQKDPKGKKDDKGKDIWYPQVKVITEDARKQLNDTIIGLYRETVGNTGNQGSPQDPSPQTNDGIPW